MHCNLNYLLSSTIECVFLSCCYQSCRQSLIKPNKYREIFVRVCESLAATPNAPKYINSENKVMDLIKYIWHWLGFNMTCSLAVMPGSQFFFFFSFNSAGWTKKKSWDCCTNTSDVGTTISPAELLCADRGTAPPPEHSDQHFQPLAASSDRMLVFQHARSIKAGC